MNFQPLARLLALTLVVSGCGASSEEGGASSTPGGASPTPEPTAAAASPTEVEPTPVPVDPPTFSGAALPDGQERVAYSHALQAQGPGPIDYALVGGELPWGLTLDAEGTLRGTPSQQGDWTFTVRARNAGGSTSASFSLGVRRWEPLTEVACGATFAGSLSASVHDEMLKYNLKKPGATQWYFVRIGPEIAGVEVEVSSDTLDPVLMVSRGDWPLATDDLFGYRLIEDHEGSERIRVHDASPYNSMADWRAEGFLPFAVAGGGPGSFAGEVRCLPNVVVAQDFLPNAVVGEPYQATLTAVAWYPPVSFGIEGALPEGLSLDPATGVISGTPTGPSSGPLRVKVTDSAGGEDQHDVALEVLEPSPLGCGEKVQVAPTSYAFNADAGLATPGAISTWRLALGEASAATVTARRVSGTGSVVLLQARPDMAPGSVEFDDAWRRSIDEGGGAALRVTVEDMPLLQHYRGEVAFTTAQVWAPGAYEVEVSCEQGLALAQVLLPHPVTDQPYDQGLTVVGAGEIVTFTVVEGALPPGLELSEDGRIHGTPSGGGSYTFTVEARSGESRATRTWTLNPSADGCGGVEALGCGSFVVYTLTGAAWHNRVDVDFEDEGAAQPFCLLPGEDSARVSLTLSPVSGSNPDLFVGAPGLAPGDRDPYHYPLASALDDFDVIELEEARWPRLTDYEAPVGLMVASWAPGTYTLEVECD